MFLYLKFKMEICNFEISNEINILYLFIIVISQNDLFISLKYFLLCDVEFSTRGKSSLIQS